MAFSVFVHIILACLMWTLIDLPEIGIVRDADGHAKPSSQAPRRLDVWKDQVESRGGFHTTWTHVKIDVVVPEKIDAGYDVRCDPYSTGFTFYNKDSLEKENLAQYSIASLVGFLRVLYLLCQLLLPFIFPATTAVKDSNDWKLYGELDSLDGRQMKQISSWFEEGKPDLEKQLREKYPTLSEQVIEALTSISGDLGPNYCGYGSEALPFYDPTDVHKSARLDEIVPRSKTFNYRKALQYFTARLQESATKMKIRMPWSQQTQILIFYGQLARAVFVILKALYVGPPAFWLFYNPRWFTLTFRPEILLQRLYLFLYAVVQMWVSWRVHETLRITLRVLYGFSFFVTSPPFVPAGFCVGAITCLFWLLCALPAACPSKWLDRVPKRAFGLYILLSVFLPPFFASYIVGGLSKRFSALSRSTYMCPMSSMAMFSWSSQSASRLVFEIAILGIGLSALLSVILLVRGCLRFFGPSACSCIDPIFSVFAFTPEAVMIQWVHSNNHSLDTLYARKKRQQEEAKNKEEEQTKQREERKIARMESCIVGGHVSDFAGGEGKITMLKRMASTSKDIAKEDQSGEEELEGQGQCSGCFARVDASDRSWWLPDFMKKNTGKVQLRKCRTCGIQLCQACYETLQKETEKQSKPNTTSNDPEAPLLEQKQSDAEENT